MVTFDPTFFLFLAESLILNDANDKTMKFLFRTPKAYFHSKKK